MVQRVYRQICKVDKDAKVTVATSKTQVSAIHNQLGDSVRISVEPCRRDTFPAIALMSSYLHDMQGIDEEESVVVCPVDPYVEDGYFQKLMELSERAASSEANLVLMGIEPTYPSEKYGYIIPESSAEVSEVSSFKEKPDVKTAEEYIAQGALWNGGVFAYKLKYVLDKALEVADLTGSTLPGQVLLCINGCGTIFFGECEVIHFFKGDCIFIPAGSVFFLLLVIITNLFHYNYHMNADIASETILGEVIWKSGQIIPDTWYPSTEVRVISIPNLSAIFYGFTGNMVLASGLACCMMTILIFVSILCLIKSVGMKKADGLLMGALCLIIPSGFIMLELIYLFAGYYVIHTVIFFSDAGNVCFIVKRRNIVYKFIGEAFVRIRWRQWKRWTCE